MPRYPIRIRRTRRHGEIVDRDDIRIIARRPVSTGYLAQPAAKGRQRARASGRCCTADLEGRIIEGSCTCDFFKKHQLTHGPCEHILALRLAHMSRLEREDRDGEVG